MVFTDGSPQPCTPQSTANTATRIASQHSPSTAGNLSSHLQTPPAVQPSRIVRVAAYTATSQNILDSDPGSKTANVSTPVNVSTAPRPTDIKNIWLSKDLDGLEFKPREKRNELQSLEKSAESSLAEKEAGHQPRENVNLLDDDVDFGGEYHHTKRDANI